MSVLVLLPLLLAASPAPSVSLTQASAAEATALARAEAAATKLAGTLKGKVLTEMGKGGPAAAVNVCHDEAPAVAAALRAETGVTVGRSSLRLRNPANAGPDWVTAWLRAQGERPAAGVTGLATVVDGTARVLKPITVEAACLACHGAALDAATGSALAGRYPQDAATGYEVGDLLGALWAEVPVTP
jgi:hypothetical protein